MVMRRSTIGFALAAGVAAWPGIAAAQFPPPPPPAGTAPPAAAPPSASAVPASQPAIEQRWPDPAPAPRARPTVEPRPASPKLSMVPAPKAKPAAAAKAKPAVAAKPHPAPHPAATPNYAIACSGVFARNTNHIKLAVRYDSRNIVYTDVDGPDHAKLKASVLFPSDPNRRLEVLWSNNTARSDVQVISINGQSHWTAPKGLKLGLSLAALEKLNQRPFKLSAFGPDGASVLDWQGGALSTLPGGCKVGVRFAVGGNLPEAVRSELGGRELSSNDAPLKAVKAQIAEILLGY
jgi:hypothetical protein